MRLWFRRREHNPDAPRPKREQVRRPRDDRSHPKRHSAPPQDDPIKNWESEEQRFLRQAGDPFLDG
jgi:hypothetical protein